MPDMVVLVAGVNVVDSMLKLQSEATVVGGLKTSFEIDVEFGLTAALVNQAIIDAAKAAQTAVNGVTFLPSDKVMLFGGVL